MTDWIEIGDINAIGGEPGSKIFGRSHRDISRRTTILKHRDIIQSATSDYNFRFAVIIKVAGFPQVTGPA